MFWSRLSAPSPSRGAINESDYPTLTERQAFARAMTVRSAAEIAEMTVQLDLPVIAQPALNPADLERSSETLRRLGDLGGPRRIGKWGASERPR